MDDKQVQCEAARVKIEHLANAETAAWEEYISLARIASQTLDVKDGIACGKAWARFLRLFERPYPKYETAQGSNVIRLGDRVP